MPDPANRQEYLSNIQLAKPRGLVAHADPLLRKSPTPIFPTIRLPRPGFNRNSPLPTKPNPRANRRKFKWTAPS